MSETGQKNQTYDWGTGRRKTSVARVRICVGTGKFIVNKKELKVYFPIQISQTMAKTPLKVAGLEDKVDVFVNVSGGGTTGQVGAIIHGLSRALLKYDDSVEKLLREKKLLTRDSRMAERKKPGRRGARRGFQFSKR
jgi:small subunit ribosomal protein S9